MAVDIVMPRLSDSMTEGKVIKWLKKEGERIEKGEPVAEIETDKANMQLESFDTGTVSKILVPEGQTVPIGQPIALLGTPGEAPAAAAKSEEKVPEAPAKAPAAEKEEARGEAPSAEKAPAEVGAEVKASPLARRIAKEHNIDLSKVAGTGPGGRIVREDVEAFMSAAKEQEAPATVAAAAPAPTEAEVLELPRMGVTIAERMTRSKTNIPHFYVTSEVDMTRAKQIRRDINAALGEEREISFNDLVLKAAALALKRFPRVNASFNGDKLTVHQQINIGIAVALEDGLVVPVLKDVDKKGLAQVAADADALINRARSGRLAAGDYEGGTFTVSNLGMFGIDEFLAIINPPESAIMAIGAIKDRAVVVDGQVVVAPRMRISLSADHRVFYGATAAQFLAEFQRLLENPMSLVV